MVLNLLLKGLLDQAIENKDNLESFFKTASLKTEYMVLHQAPKKLFKEFYSFCNDPELCKQILQLVNENFRLNSKAEDFIQTVTTSPAHQLLEFTDSADDANSNIKVVGEQNFEPDLS